MAGQQIAYLWIPGFGTAVARRADPRLAGHPLVLVDEQGRVLDADGAATRKGIVQGLPERLAVARFPQALFHPATLYPVWEAQEALWSQIRRFAGRWQPAGLGSAYIDGTGVGSDLLGWCQALATLVRQQGWEPALGTTASKFGAQVAGQVAGENAALLLAPVVQRAFLARQSIAVLPLDGDALTQLRHLGIRTLGQFAQLPAAGVVTRFGPAGRTAQRWAQGLDDRPVIPPWEAPDLSTRIEFDTPLDDRERILAILAHRAQGLLGPLQERLQAVSRVSVVATRADGRIIPGSYTFPVPTNQANPVRLGLAAALDRVAWNSEPAAEITLTLAGITDAPVQQLSLFDFASDNRARLQQTLDQLSTRFGPDTFKLAALADPDSLLFEQRIRWRRFG